MEPTQSLSRHGHEPQYQALLHALQEAEAVDTSLYNRCSRWQDVVDAIEMAKARDEAKADQSLLGLRARLRHFGPEISILDSLTNMVPDQNGLSVLRGGLTTVFKLVLLRLETRATILEALENIPTWFINAIQAGQRFPDALDLRHAVAQLCDILVKNLEELIRVLLRDYREKHRVKRLLNQVPGREAETVRRCLDEITRAAKRVEQCSRAGEERAVAEIRESTRTIRRNTDCLPGMMRKIQQNTDCLPALHGDIKAAAEVMRQLLDHVQGPVSSVHLPDIRSSSLTTIQPVMTLPTLKLTIPPAPLPDVHSVLFQPSIFAMLPPPSPRIGLDDLMTALDVPEHAAVDTLAFVSRRIRDPRLNSATKGKNLMSTERFKHWLAAPPSDSDLLLVDGHCGSAIADGVSSMSAICASLTEELQRAGEETSPTRSAVIVLHHFCGQHRDAQDPICGPAGLLRSLLQQLLQQSRGSCAEWLLSFIDDGLLLGIDEHDIPSLCRLFYNLIVRLDPSRTVFCIVDGVSELETALNNWCADACSVVEMLMGVVEDTSRAGPALRVLLTSPQRSIVLGGSVVPSDGHLTLLGVCSPAKDTSLLPFQRDVNTLLLVGGTDADM